MNIAKLTTKMCLAENNTIHISTYLRIQFRYTSPISRFAVFCSREIVITIILKTKLLVVLYYYYYYFLYPDQRLAFVVHSVEMNKARSIKEAIKG